MAAKTARADTPPRPTAGTVGPKQALILLHGWGASKDIWQPIRRPPLADRFRLFALDLPGTGDAALDTSHANTTADMADYVAAQAQALGLASYSVLGHSMGANVAARLAMRHPERVDALVLVSAALHSHRLASVAGWYLRPLTGPAFLHGARLIAGAAGWLETRLPPHSDGHRELGWTRGYARRSGYLRTRNTLPALQTQLAALIDGPVNTADLPADLPILILHGERDSTIPVAWAREAAANRPAGERTRLIVYPDALHCPMDTHTTRFAADVAAFLERTAELRLRQAHAIISK